MRVVLAPTGPLGGHPAAAVARALARGWTDAAPDDEPVEVPLSDGGPGLAEALRCALPDAIEVPVVVADPWARPVPGLVVVHAGTAYVDSAQACGAHLLAPPERDPTATTTYGVGQLVAAALGTGAGRVVVGVAGSAAHDGGAGLLAALGVARRDAAGVRLPSGGAALVAVADLSGRPDPRLSGVQLVLATDTDGPLLGLFGASARQAAAGGATREQVHLLDGALTRWANVLEVHLSVSVRDTAGAGAGGGLGAALLALGARRQPAAALVRDVVGLDRQVAAAGLLVTATTALDLAALAAAVLPGVVAAAAAAAVPCVVLAERVEVGRRELAAAGIDGAYALPDSPQPGAGLAGLAAAVARQWSPRR